MIKHLTRTALAISATYLAFMPALACADTKPKLPPAPITSGNTSAPPVSATQAVPAGQVQVLVQNVSNAALDVFVEPDGGGEPQFVMELDPKLEAVQPTPPGRIWHVAQGDHWVGGFVPTAQPQQIFRFTGAQQ